MASGNTLVVFDMGASRPPASSFATLDTVNSHLVADYVNGSNVYMTFECVLPRNYAGGGITATLTWTTNTGTTGNVVWFMAFERHQATTTDLTTDHFASDQSTTTAVPGTAGEPQYTAIAFTDGAQINSIAAGESFRIKVRRNGGNASDTFANTAQLMKVELRET